MTPTDAELVAQARAGRQSACRELVSRFQRSIHNLILRMVHDRALAEDLAQETFLKAFSHLHRYDPRFKLSNWLLKIAHNTAIDHLRRRRLPMISLDSPIRDERAAVETLADPTTPRPDERLAHAEVAAELGRAVRQLRPEYREAVVLRYHEDLSHEEIADIMGVPVGTVKSYLFRARAELADRLRPAVPAAAGRCRAPATPTPRKP